MRGEVRDDIKQDSIQHIDDVSIEKQQEMLLMNKLASSGKLPPKSAGNFLQKKLQQRKFFDSGDYAMNQNKEKKAPPVSAVPSAPLKIVPQEPDKLEEDTGCATLITIRPPVGNVGSGGSVETGDSDEESQLQIPRPDTVPHRKASILHPSAQQT